MVKLKKKERLKCNGHTLQDFKRRSVDGASKQELGCEKMSPKIIIAPDHPGVGLKRAQRRSAKRTNLKLKEQLALKSN